MVTTDANEGAMAPSFGARGRGVRPGPDATRATPPVGIDFTHRSAQMAGLDVYDLPDNDLQAFFARIALRLAGNDGTIEPTANATVIRIFVPGNY